MSISKEAIEAGAEAIYMMAPWRKNNYDNQFYLWADIAEDHETFIEEATAALTSAAPYIQAAALREAAGEADDRAEAAHEVSQNRAAHDFPTRVRYAAYAEEARCIAHVLRARADQLEKGKSE